MRVTKFMGLAVVLVAMAVMVNTLAYKTAVVTNGMTITVDTTGSAKLAVAAAAAPDPGLGTSVTNGKLTLTINDKMQPDSVYTFQDAFQVTNSDAANAITLTCSTSGFSGVGVTVTILDSTDASICGPGKVIAASGTQQFRLQVSVDSTFSGTLNSAINGSFVLTGTR